MWRRWKQLDTSNSRLYVILAVAIFMLLLTAAFFLWRNVSYAYPGPAVLLFIFALALSLLLGWTWAQERDNEGRAQDSLPEVIGVEKLAHSWLAFKGASAESTVASVLSDEESRLLYQQFTIAQRMYATIPQLTIRRCFPGRRPTKSVLEVRPAGQVVQVVKFDHGDNLAREKIAYERYVERQLSDHSYGKPRIYTPPDADTNAYGAIAYEFAQRKETSTGVTLAEYYRHGDSAAVGVALDEVLRVIAGWYEKTKPDRAVAPSGYDEYRRLRDKYERIVVAFRHDVAPHFAAQLANYDHEQPRFRLATESDLSYDLPNPLHWTRQLFGPDGKSRYESWWRELDRHTGDKVSAVHGDFHAANVLVEKTPKGDILIWIIDFAKTHLGPTVQDIARLEADVKFSLLPAASLAERGVASVYNFEDRLLPAAYSKREPMGSFVPQEDRTETGEFGKARAAVARLREAAQEQMPNDARLYHLALLHATLPILYYEDRSPWQKFYAFISAALLCKRLGGPAAPSTADDIVAASTLGRRPL